MLWVRSCFKPTLPTSKSFDCIALGCRAYLEPTFSTSKSLNCNAWRLQSLPRAYLARKPIIGLYCLQSPNLWTALLWIYWAYLRPTLPTSKSFDCIASILPSSPQCYRANQKIIRLPCLMFTKPTSSIPCQPSISLDCAALSLHNLPRPYLANQQIIGLHCFESTVLLRAYLANQQIIWLHRFGLPSLPRAYVTYQANHWIALLWDYRAYLKPTLPISKTFNCCKRIITKNMCRMCYLPTTKLILLDI